MRLLLAAIAIVAVSLTLTSVLTGYLVQQLQFQDAMDQMAKGALLVKPQISQWSCEVRSTVKCLRAATRPEMMTSINTNLTLLQPTPDDRLILLSRAVPRLGAKSPPVVVYDSSGLVPTGTLVPIGREIVVSGVHVREGQIQLDGTPYLAAAVETSGTSLLLSWIVLARPTSVVAAQATSQLAGPIMESAGAGFLLAIVVSLLLSRAFTRPLQELRRAAEDITGGNYARRVPNPGRDEIGVLGRAFNRMAEAVERTRHQQRSFLANVSHELKTPLTSLIGFSQALMDGSLRTPEEKERAATILHEEAQRVLRMSQELLDLARVESGQLALHPHPVDLGVQLRQEIEIVRQRAQTRRLALQLTVPATLPPVQADPDRLHQILENLLDNAVKYAPEGTTVWITAEARPGGRIRTSVRNRVGVRPPDPNRMFDRFYRGDPSRSSAGGVGLGLAISRELAIAQSGDLRAELNADGSLSLQLELPAAPQPPTPAEAPARGALRLSPRPQLRG